MERRVFCWVWYYFIDEMGKIIFEEGKIEIASNSLFAEANTIWFGRDNTRKKGLVKFCVISDCSRLIRILNDEFEPPWEISILIGKIKSLAKELWWWNGDM
ncbi:hypothetical protein Cni_G20640 [Canna indica]|uniref:Uncharacterized protein n=1 Tax=Canna indica TaxID=4628 RepID=A0AAQ3KTI8_9LILI|nr:hypothetical protein Cni_G20640 [Canna indica]